MAKSGSVSPDAAAGQGTGRLEAHGATHAQAWSQASEAPDSKAASDVPGLVASHDDLQPVASAPTTSGAPTAGMLAAGAAPAVSTMPVDMTRQTEAAAGTSAAVPPEVQQVTPAIVALATGKDGASSLTVSLHPRDLGEVQVQMVRTQDGGTSLTVTADRAQTLEQLAHNVHHLHEALDAANIPTDQRTLTFALSSSTDGSGTAGRGASQGGGTGQNTPQRQAAWEGRDGAYQTASGDAAAADTLQGSPTRRWISSGLNITA